MPHPRARKNTKTHQGSPDPHRGRLIISKAAKNLPGGEETSNVDGSGFGTIVMLLPAGVNFSIPSRLTATAKKTGSIALKSDARYLRRVHPDSFDRFTALDTFITFAVTAIILRTAFKRIRHSFEDLVDGSPPPVGIKSVRGLPSGHPAPYERGGGGCTRTGSYA